MRSNTAWWVVLSLVGCSGKGDGPDDPHTGSPTDTLPTTDSSPTTTTDDGDGDGFGADQDCDDDDAAVFPGAPEQCDGVDEDCDGDTDEGAVDASDWYADADGDSFGAGSAVQACTRPVGAVEEAGDCDDARSDVFPGAAEHCDGVDEDCDGDTDEGAADATSWFSDLDHDGFGEGLPALACAQPPDSVAVSGDCDDTDDARYPGADERCGDLVDQDCDGAVDEDDAVDAVTFHGDLDGDGAGDPASTLVACEPPLGFVADGSDCDDSDPTVLPGAVDVCGDELDNDCDTVTDAGCPLDHCGPIEQDETWGPDRQHTVTCDVVVGGVAAPRLTIEAGAVVEFATPGPFGLFVARSEPASLVVDGSAGAVTFTSDAAAPAPGDWSYVHVGTFNTGSSIDGAVFEYGGGTQTGSIGYWGAVLVEAGANGTSNLSIADVVVRYSGTSGVAVLGGGDLELRDSQLVDNVENGLIVNDSRATLSPTSNLVLTGNGLRPAVLSPNQVSALDHSSTLQGNAIDEIRLLGVPAGFAVTESATWPALGPHYQSTYPILVQGPSAPVLTLEPGLELRFGTSGRLVVGDAATGTLLAAGTAGAPIVFTSDRTTPSDGDWRGLRVGPLDGGTVVSNAVVEFAGGDGLGQPGTTGALELVGLDSVAHPCASATPTTLTDVSMTDSAAFGLWVDADPGCEPVTSNLTYARNALGDEHYE
jgi:hypothetical protein